MDKSVQFYVGRLMRAARRCQQVDREVRLQEACGAVRIARCGERPRSTRSSRRRRSTSSTSSSDPGDPDGDEPAGGGRHIAVAAGRAAA